jgi:hypothetical protein
LNVTNASARPLIAVSSTISSPASRNWGRQRKYASTGAAGADAQAEKMQQAMAQVEAMKKAGGAQAQAAEQIMARMGGLRGGSGGSLFEMTTESGDFSTASISDSVFAIPAGYTKKQ